MRRKTPALKLLPMTPWRRTSARHNDSTRKGCRALETMGISQAFLTRNYCTSTTSSSSQSNGNKPNPPHQQLPATHPSYYKPSGNPGTIGHQLYTTTRHNPTYTKATSTSRHSNPTTANREAPDSSSVPHQCNTNPNQPPDNYLSPWGDHFQQPKPPNLLNMLPELQQLANLSKSSKKQ